MGGSVPTGEANEPTGTDQPYAIVICLNDDEETQVWTLGGQGYDRHRATFYRGYVNALVYRDKLNRRGAS